MPNAVTATEYKYDIKRRLDLLPRRDRDQLFTKLVGVLEVTPTHLRRMMAYTRESINEIRVSHLQVFAAELGCTVDDLISPQR